MRILHSDVAEAIASSLLQAIEEYQAHDKGIPVGNTPDLSIVEVEYNEEEPDDNFIIQLNDGRMIECVVREVVPRL